MNNILQICIEKLLNIPYWDPIKYGKYVGTTVSNWFVWETHDSRLKKIIKVEYVILYWDILSPMMPNLFGTIKLKNGQPTTNNHLYNYFITQKSDSYQGHFWSW